MGISWNKKKKSCSKNNLCSKRRFFVYSRQAFFQRTWLLFFSSKSDLTLLFEVFLFFVFKIAKFCCQLFSSYKIYQNTFIGTVSLHTPWQVRNYFHWIPRGRFKLNIFISNVRFRSIAFYSICGTCDLLKDNSKRHKQGLRSDYDNAVRPKE
jgi:hypothetical protein